MRKNQPWSMNKTATAARRGPAPDVWGHLTTEHSEQDTSAAARILQRAGAIREGEERRQQRKHGGVHKVASASMLDARGAPMLATPSRPPISRARSSLF